MSIDIQAAGFVPVLPARRARPRSFATIEAGRGIAALLVVLYHVDKVVANPAYWGSRTLGGVFACGHAGVEFFFVLSGFIIAHVHARDIGRPAALGHYVAKRVDRILPLYWIVLSAMTALALLGPDIASLRHVDGAAIIASYLLVGPDSHAGVLTVSWTLFHEILFYVAFGMLIVDRRLGIVVAAAWLAVIAAAAAVGVAGVPAYVASPLNLLFAGGALVEVVVRRRTIRHPLALTVAGVAAFAALGIEQVFDPVLAEMPRNLLFGVASAAALAGVVSYENARPVAVPHSLRLLGAASYSVYLVHYPALSVVAVVLRRAGLTAVLPPTAGAFVLAAAVVGIGVATHVVLERPLLAWLARVRAGRPAHRVTVPSPWPLAPRARP